MDFSFFNENIKIFLYDKNIDFWWFKDLEEARFEVVEAIDGRDGLRICEEAKDIKLILLSGLPTESIAVEKFIKFHSISLNRIIQTEIIKFPISSNDPKDEHLWLNQEWLQFS